MRTMYVRWIGWVPPVLAIVCFLATLRALVLAAPPRAETILKRRLEIIFDDREQIMRYVALLDVAGRTLRIDIPATYPDAAFVKFDEFLPGKSVSVDPDRKWNDPLGLAICSGFLLVMSMPSAWALGHSHIWWYDPARMFLYFGLVVLVCGGISAYGTFQQVTQWPRVQAAVSEVSALDVLDRRSTEILMDSSVRDRFKDQKYDVLSYVAEGVRFRLPVENWGDAHGVCYGRQSCEVTYNPADPRQIAAPKQMTAETFALGLALGGFGFVFSLMGLLISFGRSPALQP